MYPPDCHAGGHQSPGQPDQADGMIRAGGAHPGSAGPEIVTPCGSPGWTSWSGPTVDGGTWAGSFGFGVMSSGGLIDRSRMVAGDYRSRQIDRSSGESPSSSPGPGDTPGLSAN